MSSSRRSRTSSRLAAAPPPTDEQMAELISKLQAVLPTRGGEANAKASSAEVLQEACRYIRRLHREADALSERLAELLLLQPSDLAINGADVPDLIRTLLM
uniref:BHLH domain-containing protein n=1 Tax=Oryza rufipogon TaxID=4529 RepID=A0A0E0RAN4_ORYRU